MASTTAKLDNKQELDAAEELAMIYLECGDVVSLLKFKGIILSLPYGSPPPPMNYPKTRELFGAITGKPLPEL